MSELKDAEWGLSPKPVTGSLGVQNTNGYVVSLGSTISVAYKP